LSASALASCSSGAFSGRIGDSGIQRPRRRDSCGSRPARSSEDLPEPEAPTSTTKRAPPCRRRASSFSMSARVSSSRPK
jgi:hypothetical protein